MLCCTNQNLSKVCFYFSSHLNLISFTCYEDSVHYSAMPQNSSDMFDNDLLIAMSIMIKLHYIHWHSCNGRYNTDVIHNVFTYLKVSFMWWFVIIQIIAECQFNSSVLYVIQRFNDYGGGVPNCQSIHSLHSPNFYFDILSQPATLSL